MLDNDFFGCLPYHQLYKNRLNRYEAMGVAVREMDMETGPADDMLFIDGKACGIIEAKGEGAGLGGAAEQSGNWEELGI